MQTIDAIRRTNELSKVLKQHGFAETSLEAVQQANEATGTDHEVLDYEQTSEVGGGSSDKVLNKLANLERSKHLLSSRLDAAMQAHESTQAQLKQVLARLDSAEAKLRVLRNQPAQAEAPVVNPEPQAAVQEPAPMEAAQAAPAQPVAPAPEKESHPRQAQMDEAYSIENVFYCGTR